MSVEPGVYVNSTTYVRLRSEGRVTWSQCVPYLDKLSRLFVHDSLPDGVHDWDGEVVREVLAREDRS